MGVPVANWPGNWPTGTNDYAGLYACRENMTSGLHSDGIGFQLEPSSYFIYVRHRTEPVTAPVNSTAFLQALLAVLLNSFYEWCLQQLSCNAVWKGSWKELLMREVSARGDSGVD